MPVSGPPRTVECKFHRRWLPVDRNPSLHKTEPCATKPLCARHPALTLASGISAKDVGAGASVYRWQVIEGKHDFKSVHRRLLKVDVILHLLVCEHPAN